MYELIKVTENTYYIQSPAKIGIMRAGGDQVFLIDSGNDKEAGKKALRHIEANGWRLAGIINTHSNADHIGGNAYIASKTGCRIYSPDVECAFTRHPILEPSFLFGAYPPSELRHKFLLAAPSDAEPIEGCPLPDGAEIFDLPGHFFGMIGLRTPDDVVFLADCLSSKATLEKYAVSFIYDVKAYLETLEAVKNMRAKLFIPSHAEPTEDIRELADHNIKKVNEISETIESICSVPVNFEVLLKKLFDKYSLSMNFEQYALVGSTVRSYLAYLKDAGRVGADICDNMILWRKI